MFDSVGNGAHACRHQRSADATAAFPLDHSEVAEIEHARTDKRRRRRDRLVATPRNPMRKLGVVEPDPPIQIASRVLRPLVWLCMFDEGFSSWVFDPCLFWWVGCGWWFGEAGRVGRECGGDVLHPFRTLTEPFGVCTVYAPNHDPVVDRGSGRPGETVGGFPWHKSACEPSPIGHVPVPCVVGWFNYLRRRFVDVVEVGQLRIRRVLTCDAPPSPTIPCGRCPLRAGYGGGGCGLLPERMCATLD